MPIDSLESLTQFGVAGLMGALWVYERFLSRRRDQPLTEAHHKLIAQREQLQVLLRLVHRNTRAIERFEQTQLQLKTLLESMHHEPKQPSHAA